MVRAVLLVFGRETIWTLSILGGYAFLDGVLGNLPLIFNRDVGGSAIVGLLGSVGVAGGILYWFRSQRAPGIHRAKPALPMTNPASALPEPD